MKNPYYLLASLPALDWGEEPPMTSEEFLKICSDWVSAEEGRRLGEISLYPSSPAEGGSARHDFEARWSDWETFLRNRLGVARAKARGAKPFIPRPESGSYADAERAVQTAAQMANPFEKERVLDRARWDAIDDLLLMKQFHFDILLAYKLKLELLGKYAAMDGGKGFENFKSSVDAALKDKEID